MLRGKTLKGFPAHFPLTFERSQYIPLNSQLVEITEKDNFSPHCMFPV